MNYETFQTNSINSNPGNSEKDYINNLDFNI